MCSYRATKARAKEHKLEVKRFSVHMKTGAYMRVCIAVAYRFLCFGAIVFTAELPMQRSVCRNWFPCRSMRLPSLQERLPTGSPPGSPKSDVNGTPGAHDLTALSTYYRLLAAIYTVNPIGCVLAVGRAFYAACGTCCAREVSVVHHDLPVAICYNAYLQTCRTGCPTPAVLFAQSPPHPIRTVK